MKLYTLDWSRRRVRNNVLHVNVKTVDENGKIYILRKTYREWFGVLTDDVESLLKKIKKNFDSCSCQRLNDREYETMIPLFSQRLLKNDLTRRKGRFFYKIYVDTANVYDVGAFFEREEFVSYHARESWLTRVYVDFSNRFDTSSFYYNWYEIDLDEPDLLKSFRTRDDDARLPPIGIASFDMETVPWEVGSTRFPKGFHPGDVIVMISLVTGVVGPKGRVETVSKDLFYLSPVPDAIAFAPYKRFDSEAELIAAFLEAIDRPNLVALTGYNVVGFDLPCLFSRINFLAQKNEKMRRYRELFSSFNVGQHTVVTFRKKIVLDMYNYFELYKGEFDSLKLDDVAKVKFKGERRKVPIHATAIHKWYQARDRLTVEALTSDDPDFVYDFVDPGFSNRSLFGTFRTCLDYCLRDSELVMDLLTKENAVSFLVARSNLTTLNVERVLYSGKAKYIENVLETYGTRLGYFVQIGKLSNADRDGERRFLDYAKAPSERDNASSYQGALNFSMEKSFHENVSCYDFESLYPSCIMAFNVSFETFAVLHVDTWNLLKPEVKKLCECVPFAVHNDRDFEKDEDDEGEDDEGKDNQGEGKDDQGEDDEGMGDQGEDDEGMGDQGEDDEGEDDAVMGDQGEDDEGEDDAVNEDDEGKDDQGEDDQGKKSKTKESKTKETDGLVMVYLNDGRRGFLPAVLNSLLEKRRESKRLLRSDPENAVFHFNNQLTYKLVMNSTYGCLGTAAGVSIANLGMAMSVTCFGRRVLLSSYRYLRYRLGYVVPYCDTDSLFVVAAGPDLDRSVNDHLNLKPHVNLQFEKRYDRVLVLTKKKYCVQNGSVIETKGFEKKTNPLTKWMVEKALVESFAAAAAAGDKRDLCRGWWVLTEMLREAFRQSRNPENYTTRNVKALEEYAERSTAPQVRLMKREKDFFSSIKSIRFTYVFTDVSAEEDRNHNPVFAENVEPGRDVDFEKLYVSQKNNVLMLLNLAFFKYDRLAVLAGQCDRVVQWMRWKQVVHSALSCKRAFGEDLLVLYVKGVRFTFKIVPSERGRRRID